MFWNESNTVERSFICCLWESLVLLIWSYLEGEHSLNIQERSLFSWCFHSIVMSEYSWSKGTILWIFMSWSTLNQSAGILFTYSSFPWMHCSCILVLFFPKSQSVVLPRSTVPQILVSVQAYLLMPHTDFPPPWSNHDLTQWTIHCT